MPLAGSHALFGCPGRLARRRSVVVTQDLIVRNAALSDGRTVDIRVVQGRVETIGLGLKGGLEGGGCPVLDARGGLLLPGLHDHHIHVAALAAAMTSVRCGPPDVRDEQGLATALNRPGAGWLRGTAYHESVAGLIDRGWIDRVCAHRPVRVQHRSGRLWIFNSLGLEQLLAAGLPPPPGLEKAAGAWTGRLYDEDGWLRRALKGAFPDLTAAGTLLARYGVTGVTEISPGNDPVAAAHFARQRRNGAFAQRVVLAGRLDLSHRPLDPVLAMGPVKLHLHEADLPSFDATADLIGQAHAAGRVVAVHCVTSVELAFTLAAFRAAGSVPGDRIEHASITSDAMMREMAALGLAVVGQPNFVAERGDAYLASVPAEDVPALYRLAGFIGAGIVLAGGSDAPFGAPDPWAAMAAAVSRRTASGTLIGAAEALDPEQALGLFLADPLDLGRQRRIEPGAPADFCLLTKPWAVARHALSADLVRATIIAGRIVHQVPDDS